METYLKYVGDGSGLPELPARNCTKEEFETSGYKLDEVLASGLYKQAESVHAANGRKEK